MRKKYIRYSVLFAAIATTLNLSANKTGILADNEQIVIASSCFVNGKTTKFKILGKKEELLLLKISSDELSQLRMTSTHSTCGKFRDVTAIWNSYSGQRKSRTTTTTTANKILTNELNYFHPNINIYADDYTLKYPEYVAELLGHFNPQKMWEYLSNLTAFPNRFSQSQNGVDAANWLKARAEEIAEISGRTDITTELVDTGFPYVQPSLIVKVPGTDPTLEAILLGAHMDTLDGFMPGADDDGSGTSVTLEVMRVAVTSHMKFKRTIYFAWYAAEEQGLIGSDVVTKKFKSENIPLRAVLHQEVSGYQAYPQNKIYLMEDYVDLALTQFVAKLAQTYAKTEVGYSLCGYACSDHANWTREGYPVALPVEGAYEDSSPYMHSAEDDLSNVSLDHMSRFAKIGIAFVGELADPIRE